MKIFRIIVALVWVVFILPLIWVNWHNGKILTKRNDIIFERSRLLLKTPSNNIDEWPKLDARVDSLSRAFKDTNKEWIEIW